MRKLFCTSFISGILLIGLAYANTCCGNFRCFQVAKNSNTYCGNSKINNCNQQRPRDGRGRQINGRGQGKHQGECKNPDKGPGYGRGEGRGQGRHRSD